MTLQPQPISLTLPFSQAIDRVKLVLFQPFDIGKWFIIGFCAWLAHLGEGGGFGGGSHYNVGPGRGGGVQSLRAAFEHARDYVNQNLAWILPLVVAVVVLSVAIGLVILWLSSRGQFMFLHCVALNKAEVKVPWHKFARQGNSLFRFRLVLALIGFVVMVPLIGGTALMVIRMLLRGSVTAGGILGAIGFGLALVAVSIVFAVILKLTKDFVVPIQFMRGQTTREGWGALLPLLSGNVAHFILYFLFQIVLGIAILLVLLALILVTCCIAGCLMALPYIGTVLLLPVLMFKRAYSVCYLAQYGPEYDAFSTAAPAPATYAP